MNSLIIIQKCHQNATKSLMRRVTKYSLSTTSSSDNYLFSWSNTLSFSSPESDFCSSQPSSLQTLKINPKQQQQQQPIMDQLMNEMSTNQDFRNNTAYSMSFTGPENDMTSTLMMTDLLDERMKSQLKNASAMNLRTSSLAGAVRDNELSPHVNVRDLQQTSFEKSLPMEEDDIVFEKEKSRDIFATFPHEQPLPTTLHEASQPNDSRAIVITEASNPFRVVAVNSAWEGLCGYSHQECHGKTLSIIQGPETDHSAITALLSKLCQGEEAGTILTNYKKDGAKFHNRLRVGPLRNSENKVTHFVGILHEVSDLNETVRMTA